MNDTDSGETPPGEHMSEANGGQQGEGEAPAEVVAKPTHLDDPAAVGKSPVDRAAGKPQRGVPGRPAAPEPPRNRAGDIPQMGRHQDPDPLSHQVGLVASEIASIAFVACQAYKERVEQEPLSWGQLEPEIRDQITAQVIRAMQGQATHPTANHEAWRQNMIAKGQTEKDDPRIGMPWGNLPVVERRKALLFEAVVHALIRTI